MSKKKIMVSGLGGQGSGWARTIKQHPDWELTGVIDVNTELLENLSTLTQGEIDEDLGYMSLEDVIAFGEKPDAVVIATPIYAHHSLAREALDLGVNVICEKNMASSLQFGKQMVQKALDNPELCTAMGTQYRYNTNVWTAHKFMRSEEKEQLIGKLGMIKFEDYGYRGETRWGWRRFLEDVS